MTGILMCIVYTLFYLTACVDKAQTARKNLPAKGTEQPQVWNRAKHGEEVHETTTTAEAEKNSCSCSMIYDPVCASNGRSYYNLCQMECDKSIDTNVTVVHQGNCIPFRRTITVRL